MAKRKTAKNALDTFTHDEAKRKNIPTGEMAGVAQLQEARTPFAPVRYERARPLEPGERRMRDPDRDPQIIWKSARVKLTPEQIDDLLETGELDLSTSELVWRGKDEQDWSDLIADAPPIYVQEKVHPKAIVEDLRRQSQKREDERAPHFDFYTDFNGIDEDAKTEFYQHEQNWQNRMILGDSLAVMASLAERESLRGKVQCIYFDPPYGIKFNSNWQVSTRSRGAKDDKTDQISREPEQIQAFRDTWQDGIHSYLTYLRDRLTVMRDLLTDSGSIFVQIGDENVHRVRALMDEVFGEDAFVTEIVVKKKGSQKSSALDPVNDFVLWYGRFPRGDGKLKIRRLFEDRPLDWETIDEFSRAELPDGRVISLKKYFTEEGERIDFREAPKRIEQELPGARLFRAWPITNGGERARQMDPVSISGVRVHPPKGRCWSHTSRPVECGLNGMGRVAAAARLVRAKSSGDFKRYLDDFPFKAISNWWDGVGGAPNQVYVVQTNERLIERCILMATDPGDLVLDPTCGSGTTAAVAEQWGRRWITIDTSRVALALTRARLMGAEHPSYLLQDSEEGAAKEATLAAAKPLSAPHRRDLRQGFVYKRASWVTSGSIANNEEIDEIWERFQEDLKPLRAALNEAAREAFEEWEIPREEAAGWSAAAKKAHSAWWKLRIARQEEIDASIARRADVELLVDRPYEDKKRVRVTGPFTVESLSPHRIIPPEDAAALKKRKDESARVRDFAAMVLDNLRRSGVQQSAKEDKLAFSAIEGWPGDHVAAEGRYLEGEAERRAAIFVGPEFGSIQRADLSAAAREAIEAGFDLLIACGFAFDAHASDMKKIGAFPILKAKMNPDLHMASDLAGKGGNLFVLFGEPDIAVTTDETGQITVEILGLDIFDPKTGEVKSGGKDDIAAWFVDTDYDEASFFVRQAYFLGANDPYKSLKSALRAEIDQDAWESLKSDRSRPFPRPTTGRFAVKVINHFGDEVMKVFTAPPIRAQ